MATEFRAETVGSLLRPQYLKDARTGVAAGELSPAEFKRIEDRAVDEAITLQEEAGLDIVTDGELRRATFIAPLFETVAGLEPIPAFELHWTHAGTGETMTWRIPVSVTGRLRRVRSLIAEEYVYARARARKPLKQTLASPLLVGGAWNPELSPDVYPDPFELFVEATEIVREEVQELATLGCRYIQLDAPEIGSWADPRLGDSHQTGVPMQRMRSEGLDLVNSLADGVDGVTFAIHLCKGNNAGHYAASGSYDSIARDVFRRLTNYDVYLLEYDDERSGGFEPLAECPDDKTVVLGLVSSKLPELESREELAARVVEAARFHPHEQLALSTQCGFASVLEGNPVAEDVERAKLRLVSEVAHALWT